MKDLIKKLETATEDQQEELILEALQFAYDRDWIVLRTHSLATAWVRSGAYLSAAMVLVPEGWFTYKVLQAVYHPYKWLWNLQVFGTSKQAEGVALYPATALTIAAMKAHGVNKDSSP